MLTVSSIPALKDNYIWLIQNLKKECIIVDPGDALPVFKYIKENHLKLKGIFITHHHYDHTDGVTDILAQYPEIIIYGPDSKRFNFVTHPLKDNAQFQALDATFTVYSTPGHTIDHIVFYHPNMLFCGDTLFSVGCGRLFEGTPAQLLKSLDKIKKLPDNTNIYCAHEYTESNIKFALKVDPLNASLKKHANIVANLRANKETTLPSSLGLEKKINPFLRIEDKNIILAVKDRTKSTNQADILAALRSWKDNF